MKVPLSWVNEFVNLNDINLDILIEKLTLAGFEVEEKLIKTINNKSEIILDLSATANRADSLSIYGISQEIASILNQPITFPNQLINENNDTVKNLNTTWPIIAIGLKYSDTGRNRKSVITTLKTVSKPGLRVYAGSNDLPNILGNFGIAIVSTSKGVMTNIQAKKLGVGGEILCYVW